MQFQMLGGAQMTHFSHPKGWTGLGSLGHHVLTSLCLASLRTTASISGCPPLSCLLRPCLLVHLLPLMTYDDALTPNESDLNCTP